MTSFVKAYTLVNSSYVCQTISVLLQLTVFKCFFYRNITEQYLDMLFGKFGQIVQKNLLKDKLTGMPRGVAFVR